MMFKALYYNKQVKNEIVVSVQVTIANAINKSEVGYSVGRQGKDAAGVMSIPATESGYETSYGVRVHR